MKLILIAVLMSVAVFLAISSFATITEGQQFSLPLGKDEPYSRVGLRLLSMDVPQSWDFSANVEYWTTVKFEADRKPEIHRACFDFSGDGQSCVDVQAKDVTYGSHPYFRVPIHVPVGTKRIDCYAEYIQGKETKQTNTVTYYVVVLKKPEE
jgi:hypothetical protein